jgi:hypothetical protein
LQLSQLNTLENTPQKNTSKKHPQKKSSTFQHFGLDFLIDASLTPWLMEVNATPSMAVAHPHAPTRALVHDQKWPVVRDAFALLGLSPERFARAAEEAAACSSSGGGGGAAAESVADVEAELRRRGGYLPLMHLFPGLSGDDEGGGDEGGDGGAAASGAADGGGSALPPSSTAHRGRRRDLPPLPPLSIPWTAADRRLRAALSRSDEYWAAAAGLGDAARA